MLIELSDDEVELLRGALDTYLQELRIEASHTEQRDLKSAIWKDEHRLQALRRKLNGGLEAEAAVGQP